MLRILAACAIFVLSIPAARSAPEAVRRWVDAKPVDCAACHGDRKVLPVAHEPIKDQKLADCLRCHDVKGSTTLRGKLPASHIHQLAGVGCAKCHADAKNPEPVPMTRCVSCHDAKALSRRTAAVKPANPHDSPHYGQTLDCTICHHQHETTENFCLQCHSFKFAVP